MEELLSYEVLREAVAGTAAALRCRTWLQPAGGEGDKVFPPTYSGALYAVEKRRVRVTNEDGSETVEIVPCVLLDSVQSQANRMEEALQDAVDAGRIRIPVVTVDFSPFSPRGQQNEELTLLDAIGRVTSLQLPHRIADAVLRESEDSSGVPFRDTEYGRRLDEARLTNATPIFQICPTGLVFGMWDSTGPKGGLGVKFERAMTSEIVGIGAALGVRTQSRVDPVIKKNPTGEQLSKRNLGNVTPDVARYDQKAISDQNRQTEDPMRSDGSEIRAGRVRPGGVTVDYAEQTTVLSLAALRRLRFPLVDGDWTPSKEQLERDIAARVVLAALALVGAELAGEAGMDLRSRCLLWPEEMHTWELLDTPGKTPLQFRVDAKSAVEMLQTSVESANAKGLTWQTDGLTFVPSAGLVKTVRNSQLAAVKSED